MGSKQDDKLRTEILTAIRAMGAPGTNPANDFLTNDAMEGAEYLKKGDYSAMPAGSFFNFKMPQEQIKQFDNFKNAGREGTFALGANSAGSGMGNALALADGYRSDKFARDASQNYQDNVSMAADKTREGIMGVAASKDARDAAVIQGLSQMMGTGKKDFDWKGLASAGISTALSFI